MLAASFKVKISFSEGFVHQAIGYQNNHEWDANTSHDDDPSRRAGESTVFRTLLALNNMTFAMNSIITKLATNFSENN